jgi:glycerol-3-phosphate dehydrogenase
VALTLARSAALDFNAVVANYVRAVDINHDENGRVRSVLCQDELEASTFTVATRTIVNATGVWADEVFSMAEDTTSHRITPAKGVHLSVKRERLNCDVAAVLNVPGDRRSIFVVPFEEAPYTFVGTTDTAYDGALDSPECTAQDLSYLLDAVNASTSSNLTPDDVTAVWAGLRPLLSPKGGRALSERTADLSRRHRVTDTHDGVIHITGGKWTTYRQMAEDTVDALSPYITGLAKVRTKNLRLHGTSEWRPQNDLETHLYQRYGSDAHQVLALIKDDPTLAHVAIEGQRYLDAEYIHAVRHEMATSLVDLLTRRTRAHLHDARTTLHSAPAIAQLVAKELQWNDEERERQLAAYRTLVHLEFTSAGLSL